MNNLPVPLIGTLIVNIADESGRTVIPNAVFSFEQRLRLVGVGSLESGTPSPKFSYFGGDGIKIGTIRDQVYLMKSYPANLTTRSRFSTTMKKIVDGDKEHLVPIKKLSINAGVEEIHHLIIPDTELILIAPYMTSVRSGCGMPVYFFLRQGMKLARIPMPNTYGDGTFCIGTGVTFDKIPAPSELIDGVYGSLMGDNYNTDLWDSMYDYHEWHPRNGEFLLEVPFDSCHSILNETLSTILLND